MPRALFLSTAIPPLAESHTIRNVYLIRGLVRAGFKVDVVAPTFTGGDPTLITQLPADVRIHRTTPALYDRVQGLLERAPAPARRLLRSGVAVLAGNLIAPDVRRDWADSAIRLARVICKEPPALIISSAGSFTAHLAASALARDWGCPWLADYGDPWSDNPIPPASLPHIRWQNRRLERAALSSCSCISVTTGEAAALYRRFVQDRLPVHVVPCGYTRYTPAAATHAAGATTITYVGSASKGTRDLRAFLRAFADVSRDSAGNLRLEIVGAHSPSFAAEARRLGIDNVRFTGWVSYEESLRRMHEADLLLLMGNAVATQVPAKVFNYAATSVPILYLRQLPAEFDPTLRLLSRWPGVVDVVPTGGSLTAVLADTLRRLPQLRVDASMRPKLDDLQQYEWDVIGDRFAALAVETVHDMRRA